IELARLSSEWIIARRRSVWIHAQDFASQAAEVLGVRTFVVVGQTDIQLAIRSESDGSRVVAGDRRQLRQDLMQIGAPVVHIVPARYSVRASGTRCRLRSGVQRVDVVVGRKIGVQREPKKARAGLV